MKDIDNKSFLITHPFLYEINGAANVTLELATFLQQNGAKVRVYTNVYGNPVKKFFIKNNIQVDAAIDQPIYHLKDYDYIWINSQTFPISLLQDLKNYKSSSKPKIIFMHMSAHDFCPDEMPYIYNFEKDLSSLSLFVSEEAFEINKKSFSALPTNINYFRNPSPVCYSNIKKDNDAKLKSILVVDNFPCDELREISELLKKKKIKVDYLGKNENIHTMINERLLEKYDTIITIGKTVQYCLVSGTPVYIYGAFGGPGWLSDKKFALSKEKNFSGRGFSKKTPEEIVDDIYNGYENAKTFYRKNLNSFKKQFLISNVLPSLLQQATASDITPHFSNARINAYTHLLRLIDIAFNWRYEASLKNELVKKNDELSSTITQLESKNTILSKINKQLEEDNLKMSEIINSRSVQTWLKINNRIKKHSSKTPKPEIVAVLCVYNEQLNIELCLQHIEPFVDKIVIYDDGSTDNTPNIIKQHKKVVKVIHNKSKTHWDERKNRETVLRAAYGISKKKNVWALCVDADERFEKNFLKNLRAIANKYYNKNVLINIHFRELWDNLHQYRVDGVWNEKRKDLFFQLQNKMTFQYPQSHHFPWHYQELNNRDVLLNYNLYHLKMIKETDRINRAKLYNTLDPEKKLQSIGYDYLTDKNNLKLKKIPEEKNYDISTVPDYYK